ncbi:MAG TPA: crotonyl-CoA carboxylase/reductase [Solirubrobacterales bacterium]
MASAAHAAGLTVEPGELPTRMSAWVMRPEREGDLDTAYEFESLTPPEPGPLEVVVRVMAAGLNYNSIWAARAEPISIFDQGDHPRWGHHIAGSDASGIVWKTGAGVTRWKPGDEVVIHGNHASYEDPEVHGLDPLAAPSQLGYGYQTTWGTFAEFCKVQAQQLVPKPEHLSWADAATYGVCYFTAYRMLVDKCNLQAGQRVLIWGAGGGLGAFAVQLCRVAGADCVGIVSTEEKGRLAEDLGATACIDRREFDDMRLLDEETPERAARRAVATRAFAKRVKHLLGEAPDVVFEHVGREVFAASVFTARPFGKIVTCGATTGWNLEFDVRHLWMRQKQILGSHAFNGYEAYRANELVRDGKVKPVVWRTFDFDRLREAHRLMAENLHIGKIALLVGATDAVEGGDPARAGTVLVG